VAKGVEAIKTLEEPTSSIISILRSNILIVLLVVIAVLLWLNLRRKSKSHSYPLQGSMSFMPILDIVSLLNSNLKSGRLMIVSQSSRGEIFFEKGEIIHARMKGWDGKTAFHKIMALRSGRYTFINRLPNIRHTISEPLSLLLLSMKSGRTEPKKDHGKDPGRQREKIFS
jgi:hypothetical protein